MRRLIALFAATLLTLAFVAPVDAGPLRLVARSVAKSTKVLKIVKVLKPVGKVAKAVLPPYRGR